jgi:hypothetical protein
MLKVIQKSYFTINMVRTESTKNALHRAHKGRHARHYFRMYL